jgi:hypothetical protein
MSAIAGIVSAVVIFIVYFFFLNNWNRRRYMQVFKFCKFYLPLFAGSNTSQKINSDGSNLVDSLFLTFSRIKSYAKDNGYTFEGGVTGEYDFNNIRSPSGKKIIDSTKSTPLEIFVPAFVDTEDEPMYLKTGARIEIKGATAGEFKGEYILMNKDKKNIVALYIHFKDDKLDVNWDYKENTLIQELDDFRWALKGPIPYDWQDVKRWVSGVFK